MSDRSYSRRTVIKTGSALALAGLAGCTTSSANNPTTEGGSGGTEEGDHHEDDGHHEDDNTHHEETSHEDGHGHEHGGLPEKPSANVTVGMKTTDSGTHFDPHVVWVEKGGTVTWELESGSHTATAYHPDNDKPRRMPEGADSFASGTVSEEGATFEHTFETEGVYDYYCAPHEAMGMIGTVVVGEPDAHDQPALAEPGDGIPEKAHGKVASLNEKANEMLGHTHDDEDSGTTESGHDDDHDDGHDDDHDDGHDDGHDDDHDDGHDDGTTESGHDDDHDHDETTDDGH